MGDYFASVRGKILFAAKTLGPFRFFSCLFLAWEKPFPFVRPARRTKEKGRKRPCVVIGITKAKAIQPKE